MNLMLFEKYWAKLESSAPLIDLSKARYDSWQTQCKDRFVSRLGNWTKQVDCQHAGMRAPKDAEVDSRRLEHGIIRTVRKSCVQPSG